MLRPKFLHHGMMEECHRSIAPPLNKHAFTPLTKQQTFPVAAARMWKSLPWEVMSSRTL